MESYNSPLFVGAPIAAQSVEEGSSRVDGPAARIDDGLMKS